MKCECEHEIWEGLICDCECHKPQPIKPQWEEEFPTEITERFVVPKYILDQRVTEYKAELIKKIEGLKFDSVNFNTDLSDAFNDGLEQAINIIKE